MSQNLLELQQISKSYVQETSVLHDVSFSANAGELIGLLGPNGAGKTTLLRILATLLKPSVGKILINGKDISQDLNILRSQLGYVPEEPPLYPEMTPNEYLKFFSAVRVDTDQSKNSKEILSSIDRVTTLCDLQSFLHKPCGILSRGQRQRVSLAQALIHNPQIIILDEPTLGLDPLQLGHFRETLLSLKNDHLIIMSSHQLPEVMTVSTRVLCLVRGKIVFDSPVQEPVEAFEKNILQVHLQ
jgi:ABC-2 type transport system ATP-binding protein